jgi:hypothetical protein
MLKLLRGAVPSVEHYEKGGDSTPALNSPACPACPLEPWAEGSFIFLHRSYIDYQELRPSGRPPTPVHARSLQSPLIHTPKPHRQVSSLCL